MKNKVVLIIRHFHCLYLMYFEVVWVLVSSGNQVQQRIILDPDHISDYITISYD